MKSITIIIIMLNSFRLLAQTNLVQNGGFELGIRHGADCQSINSELTGGYNSLSGCDSWYQALADVDECTLKNNVTACTTADWYDNAICSNNPDMLNKWGLPPTSGTSKCAGMILNDNYTEGIRTTLLQNLNGGKYYKLSMRIAVGQSNNPNNSTTAKAVSVDISFAKFSENWNATPANSSNVRFGNAINLGIPANSPHRWYEVTKYFRVPAYVEGGYGSDLSEMIIRRSAGNDDVRSYIYVDDISLTEVDFCSTSCSPAELHQNITYECCGAMKNTFPNAIKHDRSFNFIVSNATEVELLVYDRWGALVKHMLQYDPNGLRWEFDPQNIYHGNYPHLRFYWAGEDNSGNYLPSGVYPIQINMRNCDRSMSYTSSVTILDPCYCDKYKFPDTTNARPFDCCPELLLVDNKYYNFIEREQANKYLTAGLYGPVVVTSIADVTYTAGLAIDLGPNFSTEPGSRFDAYTEACNAGGTWITSSHKPATVGTQMGPQSSKQDELRFGDTKELATSLPANNDQRLYPNPAQSFVMIRPVISSSCDKTTVEISDLAGKVISSTIYSQTQSGEVIRIPLNETSSGLYQVVIKSCDKTSYEKLLIERP